MTGKRRGGRAIFLPLAFSRFAHSKSRFILSTKVAAQMKTDFLIHGQIKKKQ